MAEPALPTEHAAFLRAACERLPEDPRIVGIAAGGSFVTGGMDAYSDLDLIIAVEPDDYASVESERLTIATGLGELLAGFTGEHVGEPRVLICLYGPPLLHVDLKFVRLDELADRVEDPAVLWQRQGRLDAALRRGRARFPDPDLQWIEDRFWVWLHYGAGKVGRGELFEAHDFLAFLRAQVLGPLILQVYGARPTGVRRIEQVAPEAAVQLQTTLARYDPDSCLQALRRAAEIYRDLRARIAPEGLVLRDAAELSALRYLSRVEEDTSQ